MRIGVIGAGWLGGTVGRLLAHAGHDVLLSSRHPGRLRTGERIAAGMVRDAAAFGDVLLTAVPYRALEGVGREIADLLPGRIVLDACNPNPSDPPELMRAVLASGIAECSVERLPGARLVRAFSSVDATEIEASAARDGPRLGVPLAGDDRDAVAVAKALVRDAGCEPVLVGGLDAGRRFQRGEPAFRAHLDAPALRRLLGLGAITD